MKASILLIMAALFAACTHQTTDNKTDDLQDDSLECCDGDVCMSEDGRITIESGRYSGGGTSPDYWTVWTIRNDEGEKHKINSPVSFYQDNVHSLSKNDGTTYYLVNCSGKASSRDGYEWLEAYEIVGDSVERVNVMDGSFPYQKDDRFSVNYEIPSWYYATKGAGYDWILEYDSHSKELYVAITTDDNEIIDRYNAWRFDGEQFVYQGERQNKHLNDTLSQYDRLLQYVTTEDHTVRVDLLADGKLRYASWYRPKTTEDAPDIVLTGGEKVHYEVDPDQTPPCDEYHFWNGSYEYIVNHCEIGRDDEGKDTHQDYLIVRTNRKVLYKEKIEK